MSESEYKHWCGNCQIRIYIQRHYGEILTWQDCPYTCEYAAAMRRSTEPPIIEAEENKKMSLLIKGMEMPKDGNETIVRIQPDGTILDQYGHHLAITAIEIKEETPYGDICDTCAGKDICDMAKSCKHDPQITSCYGYKEKGE